MEAHVLLAQLTKARDSWVKAGAFEFQMRRPTEMKLVQSAVVQNNEVLVNLEMLKEVITGWKNVKESDVVEGGASEEIAFDRSLYVAWISDRPDLWQELINGVQARIAEYRKRFEELPGN